MRRSLVALATALALAAPVTALATPASAAPVAPGGGITPLAASSTFPLADPDTVLAKDGTYVTYGTTVGAGTGARCGATGKLYVPVLAHGSGSDVGMSDCASADALPSGPGAWAEPGGAIWAPGVARFGERYFMFYTASRKGSGQKCIGRAISGSARGPFVNQGEWACPGEGRWALDANPFVAGSSLYVTYRDDAIATGAETGISTVRTDGEGRAVWDTRRDMLKSTDITWDTAKTSGGTHVVENPSMWSTGGRWYLAYSGNNWDSPRYSTGIADCGTTPLPGSHCTPITQGVARPYFGFTGASGINPIRGLPGNHQGPGGMDVFAAANGSLRVVWHWWNGSTRFPMTGVLTKPAAGFTVS
ncbi:family 43 glycosylhydrolase [Phytomonospora endophytica]|uniref:Glycosyl hydrolase family 43 n=1 Tax=Phytomonospora endophytica TaxID=714109 RepID=A0A841FIB5_9ACTN|nr:family 43 glycosylhydrolase [Phytomonospora endophytica]MBB6035946.1 hypothetical protein [Phytomonospora endophytica]GIG66851.1 hypothetical protein Pen01_31460 [Phytomonospora endophytica]